MIGPNLSEWALKKRSLVVFLMILAVVAGVMSFFKLGRGEDPAITTRTMVVAAGWPGATVDETHEAGHRAARAHAAGDRLPRPLAQLHHRRADDDLRRPEAIDAASQDSRHLVPGAQEHRRHAPHAAAGRARAVPQRRLRRHLRHHLWVHRRRLQFPRTARPRRGGALAAAAVARRVEDRGHGRAGRADLHRVLHRAAGRPAPEPEPDRRHAAGAEPGAPGRHDPGRAGARVPARVRRLRLRARHRGGEHRRRRAHLPPRRHRHRAPRLHRSAAADVPRQRQAGHRPGDRHARRRRHPGARRERAQGDGRDQGQPAGRHRAGAGRRPGGHRRSSRSTTS